MDCQEVRKRIYPLLDDELETETNIEVLAHLNVCDRCQEKFEAERTFLEDLSGALRDREVPEEVQEDIEQRLQEARERKRQPSWFSSKRRRSQMMSAAVFLLLVVMAGILSNQFPLYRDSSAERLIRTFPEYHNDVLQREKDTFAKRIEAGAFETLDDVKSKLVRQFPVFRDQLTVPSLEDNQCEVLDAETLSAANSAFRTSNFHIMYCYMGGAVPGDQSHEGVMLVGVERSDVDLDRITELRPVRGSDGFYINTVNGTVEQEEERTHCVFWKTDRFLMAMVTNGLERDHLTELARSARTKMASLGTGSPPK